MIDLLFFSSPIKGHFEQEENARELGYTHEDIFQLNNLILEKINEKRKPESYQGARNAAELIKILVINYFVEN